MRWTREGFCALLAAAGVAPAVMAADPWADRVLFYEPGMGAAPYTNPLTVLGSPERFTGEGIFPGAVTPFNPAWGTDEVVSVGRAGRLVVAFGEPVTDDPLNPFGIDLLIFGNAGHIDLDYPTGLAGPLFGSSTFAFVEVSPDGITWTPVPGFQPDSHFPTMGYADLTDPYALSPGAVPTDFTRPVNPALSFFGKTYADILDGYAGSGGGAGIDLAGLGLAAISYVRFTSLAIGDQAFQIDALADVSPVPSPGAGATLTFLALAARRRRR